MIRLSLRVRLAATGLLAAACLALVSFAGEAQDVWYGDSITRDSLLKHFSAREWEPYTIDDGFMLKCTSKSCADPALVAVQVQKSSPELAEKIKTGAVKDILLKGAATLSGVSGVQFTINKVEVQQGEVPQFFMIYSCVCGGSKRQGMTKVAVTGRGTIVVNSLALKSENAVRYGSKLLEVLVDRAKN